MPFTFVIIHIHHAVTRLFPWTWRSSRKRTSGPPTGHLTDGHPPTGNAVVYHPGCQSVISIISYMYVLVLDLPCLCLDLPVCRPAMVRIAPVPPSLSVVAPVVATLVPPHPIVTLVLATPFPPNPIVDSLVGATPRTPTPVLNI